MSETMKDDEEPVTGRDLIPWIIPALLLLAGLAAFFVAGRSVGPITPAVTVEAQQ